MPLYAFSFVNSCRRQLLDDKSSEAIFNLPSTLYRRDHRHPVTNSSSWFTSTAIWNRTLNAATSQLLILPTGRNEDHLHKTSSEFFSKSIVVSRLNSRVFCCQCRRVRKFTDRFFKSCLNVNHRLRHLYPDKRHHVHSRTLRPNGRNFSLPKCRLQCTKNSFTNRILFAYV